MTASIHQLHKPPAELSHFIRLGNTGHVMLSDLLAAGRLPVQRAVVDAAHAETQAELLDAFHQARIELVLDPRTAELGTPGGLKTSARNLPWARDDRPHLASDFSQGNVRRIVEQIAEFAVGEGARTVLSPSHLLTEISSDPWISTNAKSCEDLRLALDEFGGKNIAIDYSLTLTYELFRNPECLGEIIRPLADLPYDNLWVRVSGFAADQPAAGVKKYIEALRMLQTVGKPIVADQIGGLAGLSFLALGAAGGICHGVASKERFDTSSWRKPSEGSGGGGRPSAFTFLDWIPF